jgi:hypothetical protein
MRPEAAFVADMVALLLAAVLGGVVVRRRTTSCLTFTAYLGVALTANRLITWWPDVFYRVWFAATKELLYAALKLAITLELALSALGRFPRARRQAVVGALIIGGVAAVLVTTTHSDDLRGRIGLTTAFANLGAMGALATLLGVVYWYRLPLDEWNRMIMLGLLMYGGVYGVLLASVGLFGLDAVRYLTALDPAAYAATVGLWVVPAWRPRSRLPVMAEAAKVLP